LNESVFWLPPEVIRQSAHTIKIDIWSVGCLAIEMFTGEHPWAPLTQMQAVFRIGSATLKPTFPLEISNEASDFLQRIFEIDYKKRPTAAEGVEHP
jgi:mitogen-activated protein kinase kinase kinase